MSRNEKKNNSRVRVRSDVVHARVDCHNTSARRRRALLKPQPTEGRDQITVIVKCHRTSKMNETVSPATRLKPFLLSHD
ncbi:hypothetical protein EVAR_35765_1 [Eumeta japonica]|uniref:Uncharacterized protein n=1 Tax=Eumeta variegata TaxID=151549 RepID=A0A4C1WM95_EUMVA|nr:hypothetical protein EVAR_35765_1 [Eumeta japonica]